MNYKKENIKNKIIDDLNTRNENWEKLSRAQSFIDDKEETRKESEAARELNEEERKLNETARVKAENERVSAEQNRVTAENERNDLYGLVQQKLENGEFVGKKGDTGDGLEYVWSGTELGVRKEGETEYVYVNLKGEKGADGAVTFEDLTPAQVESLRGEQGLKGDTGDKGDSIEYDWDGTQLGVRTENEPAFNYVDLKGEKGDTGSISDLNAEHIETALGFTPVHPVGGVTTKRKESMIYYNLGNSGGSTDIDLSASNTIVVYIIADNVIINFDNVNTMSETNDTIRMIYDNSYRGYDAYINHRVNIDGVQYSTRDMYRIPDGIGVIEFDFVRIGSMTNVYGTTGGSSVGGLTKDHVETALGYVPADETDLSTDAITLQGRNPSSFVEVVNHGTTSDYARPVGGISVLWIGTVEPQNAIDNDIWIGGL